MFTENSRPQRAWISWAVRPFIPIMRVSAGFFKAGCGFVSSLAVLSCWILCLQSSSQRGLPGTGRFLRILKPPKGLFLSCCSAWCSLHSPAGRSSRGWKRKMFPFYRKISTLENMCCSHSALCTQSKISLDYLPFYLYAEFISGVSQDFQ